MLAYELAPADVSGAPGVTRRFFAGRASDVIRMLYQSSTVVKINLMFRQKFPINCTLFSIN